MAGQTHHARPLWLAALLTCIAMPPLVLLVGIIFNTAHGEPLSAETAARGLGALLTMALPVFAIVMFAFVYPFVLALKRRDRLWAPFVCAGTLVIGAVLLGGVGVVLPEILSAGADAATIVVSLAWGGAIGLLAGIVFSLIAGIRWSRHTP